MLSGIVKRRCVTMHVKNLIFLSLLNFDRLSYVHQTRQTSFGDIYELTSRSLEFFSSFYRVRGRKRGGDWSRTA